MDSELGASSDPEDSQVDVLPPSRALVPAPVGAAPDSVRAWFDTAVETSEPVLDGTLASERDAADSYRRMAKADNTRRAYRAAVRAWCAWCDRHELPPLPASGQDVAAFLAGERWPPGATHEIFSVDLTGVRAGSLVLQCPMIEDNPFWRKGHTVGVGAIAGPFR